MLFWEQLEKLIRDIEPLLLVIIPTCFGIYLKLKNKIIEKEKEVKNETIAKNKEELINWEHIESLKVVDRIKNACNYYKDISNADLVNFMQFENGTTATSKLSNMYLSCIAEDSRFGKVPKMLSFLQRKPYSCLSDWVNNIMKDDMGLYFLKDVETIKSLYSDILVDNIAFGSECSGLVKDPNGIVIGFISFYFAETDFNGKTEEQCKTTLIRSVASIEEIILDYQTNLIKKKKELNII